MQEEPYSNLNPGRGAVSRMWTDTINAMGKPMGLRAGNMNLAQYCGWENENGPSGPRNGSRGLVTILRILNPPNSLTNVLQIHSNPAITSVMRDDEHSFDFPTFVRVCDLDGPG